MRTTYDGLTALVAEDSGVIRKGLKLCLEELGFAVLEAGDGQEALRTMHDKPVDLAFTDIVMPVMDGFELCQEVRKTPELRHVPMVVVSTYCDGNHIIRALRVGADDYVTKPIEKGLVRRVVARVLTPTFEGRDHG